MGILQRKMRRRQSGLHGSERDRCSTSSEGVRAEGYCLPERESPRSFRSPPTVFVLAMCAARACSCQRGLTLAAFIPDAYVGLPFCFLAAAAFPPNLLSGRPAPACADCCFTCRMLPWLVRRTCSPACSAMKAGSCYKSLIMQRRIAVRARCC